MKKYQKHNVEKVIHFFTSISNKSIDTKYFEYGICAEYLEHFRGAQYPSMQEIRNLSVHWKHYSGFVMYPIPNTSKKYPDGKEQYLSLKPKWTGKQGKLRRKLCKYMAKAIRKACLS